MADKKIKVLYDATLLSYFSEKNEKRSGVYFVTYNILKEILNHPEFEVTLYCDYKRTLYMQQLMKQDEMLRQFKLMEVKDITNPLIGLLASMNFKFRKAPEIKDNILFYFLRFIAFRSFHIYDRIRNDSPAFKKKLQEYDAYFSPYEIIPQEVEKDKTIKKFLFLHDTIPVILEDLYNEINLSSDWFRRLLKSLNKEDFYFANSLSTKNDFIKYAPSIITENITVAYLGADEKFCRTTDEEKILQIKRKYNIPEDKKYIFSLCSVEPRKNLIFAVKNFVEFIKKNNIDDFVFVLGGGQVKQFQPKLEKELSDLREFQDKILKIGYVADEDLAALYSGAEMEYDGAYQARRRNPYVGRSDHCPWRDGMQRSLRGGVPGQGAGAPGRQCGVHHDPGRHGVYRTGDSAEYLQAPCAARCVCRAQGVGAGAQIPLPAGTGAAGGASQCKHLGESGLRDRR